MKKAPAITRRKSSAVYRLLTWVLTSEKSNLAILMLIIIGGFFIRIYRLDFLSLWVDEYVHLSEVNRLLSPESGSEGDTNGIFLTWCMLLLIKVFGASEFTVRLPSVIMSTLSIPLVYVLAKNLFNRGVGIISAFLFSSSLYVVCWARIGRNYASFEFAFLLLLICFWFIFNPSKNSTDQPQNFFTRNRLSGKYLLLFPLALIFTWLNHQLVFVGLFGMGAYIVLEAIIDSWKRRRPFISI